MDGVSVGAGRLCTMATPDHSRVRFDIRSRAGTLCRVGLGNSGVINFFHPQIPSSNFEALTKAEYPHEILLPVV